MDNIIPRKYRNPVTIGLAVAFIVAAGVAIYYYSQQPSASSKQPLQVKRAVQPQKPEQIETRIDGAANVKPALVLIWAEWCGPSQHFKPTWDKIASHLSKEGAIDAIDISDGKNKEEVGKLHSSIPGFPGFPHIRYYPEGYGLNKPSSPYQGNRTEEDVLKFAYQAYGA